MKKIILIAIFSLNLIAQDIINGDINIIKISADKAGELTIDNKKSKWLTHPKDKNLKFAIIPANYYKKGKILVQNKLNDQTQEWVFDITNGAYKKEQIKVSSSKVKPPKNVLSRIENEKNEANKIYATATPNLKFKSKFKLPLKSLITSPFGTARLFNNSLKSYHSGADFRAATNTKIFAANDGVVVIAKDRYYAGKSVVIDHGEGIYTQYYHLNKLKVKTGARVKKGDLIGLSGATGRVNGPHLHFGVIAGGVQVNPLNFIKKINLLFN